jgi:deazaflavin-dependent oxidoreductase (nitroreductase family)
MQSPLAKLDPGRPPLRWLLRFPTLLYRAHLGWLFGERLLRLTVTGRRSGLPRAVVLEVIGRSSSGLFVASAWGERAEWVRNVMANPRVQVQVGWRRFAGEVSRVGEPTAVEILRAYAGDHPWAYRLFIGPLLLGRRPSGTADELAALARGLPILLVQVAT